MVRVKAAATLMHPGELPRKSAGLACLGPTQPLRDREQTIADPPMSSSGLTVGLGRPPSGRRGAECKSICPQRGSIRLASLKEFCSQGERSRDRRKKPNQLCGAGRSRRSEYS